MSKGIKTIQIRLFDDTNITGTIRDEDIEFEGVEDGEPYYTATIKGSDGKEYDTPVSSDCLCKIETDVLYEQDDPDEDSVYVLTSKKISYDRAMCSR